MRAQIQRATIDAKSASQLTVVAIASLFVILAGCGGGGGGDGGPVPVRSGLPDALTFLEPITIVRGEVYETARSVVDFRGGFQSQLVATLDCSTSGNFTPTPFREVRWRNLANGETGRATSAIGCVNTGTIFGVGVKARWWADFIYLEFGANIFQFDVLENGAVIGRSTITVWRTDGQPPSVSFAHPAPDSSAAALDGRVLVLFSEAMRETSLDVADLVISTLDGTIVPGLHRYDPKHFTWTFEPNAPLSANTSYRVLLRKSVEDEFLSGGLEADVEWQFATGSVNDTVAPSVVRQWPAAPCACSPPTTRILLESNEPLDPSSVVATTMTLTDSQQNAIAGRIVYLGRILEFVPDMPLAPNETYTVQAAGLADLVGNIATDPVSWQFTVDEGSVTGAWQELAALPFGMSGVLASDGTDVYALANGSAANLTPGFRAFRYRVAAAEWQPLAELSRSSSTDSRISPSVIWDGSELIVFGGFGDTGGLQRDGGRYDPINDSWEYLAGEWWDSSRTSSPIIRGIGAHSAIWTGDRMLIWGGLYDDVGGDIKINRGWVYNPVIDSWTITGPEPTLSGAFDLLPDPNAPRPRSNHAAVWTGTEMLVWGGTDEFEVPLADGGRYELATDTWQPLSPVDAPSAMAAARAAWTGNRMLIWSGGLGNGAELAGETMRRVSLTAYDPVTDAWQPSATGWEPAFLDGTEFFTVWTGTEVIAIGTPAGEPEVSLLRKLAAYVYDPTTDRWRAGAEFSVPFCRLGAATWHADQVVVLCSNDAYAFVP